MSDDVSFIEQAFCETLRRPWGVVISNFSFKRPKVWGDGGGATQEGGWYDIWWCLNQQPIKWLQPLDFPDRMLWANELHAVHLLWWIQEPLCPLQLLLWARFLLQGASLYLYLYLCLYLYLYLYLQLPCPNILPQITELCEWSSLAEGCPLYGRAPGLSSSESLFSVIISFFVWRHHQHLCLTSSSASLFNVIISIFV